MIRFHLPAAVLGNIRVADRSPVLESLTGAATALQNPRWRPSAFAPDGDRERSRFANEVFAPASRPGVERALTALTLTVTPTFMLNTKTDFAHAVQDLLDMSPKRIEHELRKSTELGIVLPEWMADLATDRHGIRNDLVRSLWRLQQRVVAPLSVGGEKHVDTERIRLARMLASVGPPRFLDSLHPQIRMTPGLLEFRQSMQHHDADVSPKGITGILVSASPWFATPSVNRIHYRSGRPGPLLISVPTGHSGRAHPIHGSTAVLHTPNLALSRLLGGTRCRVLEAVAAGGGLSTTQIGQLLGIATSSASEHLAVLRSAGLIDSSRPGSQAAHEITPLGVALLHGRA